MADSKISALTAASVAALANEFAINEAGTSKRLTGTLMSALFANPAANEGDDLGTTALRWLNAFLGANGKIDFNNGDVTLTHGSKTLTIAGGTLKPAAGTTSVAPVQLQSGSLLTTAIAGGLEYLTNVLYASPSASNRGVLPATHLAVIDSDLTGTNGTAVQAVFPAAFDRLTVIAATTYIFELFLHITCGATTTTLALAFDGGTCSYTSFRYVADGSNAAAVNTTTTAVSKCVVDTAAVTVINATGTGTSKFIHAKGIMRVNASGTMFPQFKFSADPTGTILVKKDSFMTLTPVGSNTVSSVGNWA